MVGGLRRLSDQFWRVGADLRRIASRAGSARSALESVGTPNRSNRSAWIAATDLHHERYRETHDVPDASVALVCVSNRPEFVERAAVNMRAQRGLSGPVDLVFVANGAGFDSGRIRRAFENDGRLRVVEFGDERSLGDALNEGLGRTDARFVAKFDDDDHYGANYLADSLRAFASSGAGVVGKHSYYARLDLTGETVLRFPYHEFSYTATLAGGTLVIDRDVVGDQRFDDVSIGEDRAFLTGCHRRGISTFSADRFNFTQVRGTHNTWQMDRLDFLVDTIPVPADEVGSIDR